ncbi:hypothetical protein Q5X49_18370 [Acinetobacter baumannii]|nr:hypothetical protein [Acinetobacter baumannii]
MTYEFLATEKIEIGPEIFKIALAEFAHAIGAEYVRTDSDALGEFHDPFQPVLLWSLEQGRNNGYGGTAPRLSSGVTVNFHRMNNILELNEELGYLRFIEKIKDVVNPKGSLSPDKQGIWSKQLRK